ncbi:MAG TPA: hypothetical protein PK867_10005 [Pirellulales bacterium]|nr:hypothetical protein [Pirellulales bacterium]
MLTQAHVPPLFFLTDAWLYEDTCVANAILVSEIRAFSFAAGPWSSIMPGNPTAVNYGVYLQDAGTYVDAKGNRVHLSAGRIYDPKSVRTLVELASNRTLVHVCPHISASQCPAFLGLESGWQPCKYRVLLKYSFDTITDCPDFAAAQERRKVLGGKWAAYNAKLGFSPRTPQWKEDLDRAQKISLSAGECYPAALHSGDRKTPVVIELTRDITPSVREAILYCANMPEKPLEGVWLRRSVEWCDEGAPPQRASKDIAEVLEAEELT